MRSGGRLYFSATANPTIPMNSTPVPQARALHAGRSRHDLAFAASVALLIVLVLLALRTGAVAITLPHLVDILASTFGFALPSDVAAQSAAVLLTIRLPRVVLAVVAGAGLAATGAVLQAVFRNPLADPTLIGVSSGAALAVTATIVFGAALGLEQLRWIGPFVLPVAGFVGGLVATVVLYRVATVEGVTSLATMLLAGIAINALCFAGIGLMTTMASNEQLRNISFWNFGSVAGAGWDTVGVVALVVLAAIGALARSAPGLNALALGEIEARHLGFDTQRLKRNVIAWSALIAGFIVAVCGVIGFVALVGPHVARLAWGADNRRVIGGSALLGAILLLAADLLARAVAAPAELPIGIVTALVGAPFFLWMLLRDRGLSA